MTKGGKQEVAAVGHNSYAGTRFNAAKHAVLSRYTVLPWEDVGEYEGLFSALVEEHMPEGPTETHLVEELAGSLVLRRMDRRGTRGALCGPGSTAPRAAPAPRSGGAFLLCRCSNVCCQGYCALESA